MPPSPSITYDDFAKVDLRVGRVLEVQPFPKARNPSWKVRVNLGELGEKWSSAQITNYTADQLVGSLVVCVCNFPPCNIAGFISEVLILGAPDPDNKIILLSPRKDAEGRDIVSPGAKVYGLSGDIGCFAAGAACLPHTTTAGDQRAL